MISFKNPRDKTQFTNLARQFMQRKYNFLLWLLKTQRDYPDLIYYSTRDQKRMIDIEFVPETSMTKINLNLSTSQIRKNVNTCYVINNFHSDVSNESFNLTNMTSRMLKQSDNLKLLHKGSPLQRKVLLKSANPALVHAICDCITNIIHQRIPIAAKQKGVLAKQKKHVESISKQQNKNFKEEKTFNSTR